MSPWLTMLAIAALLFLSRIQVRAWRRERLRRRWRELGPALELAPSVAAPSQLLVGSHRGHPVEVSLPRTGGSRLRLLLDARLPEGSALTPQRWGVSKRQDLQMGLPLLDDAYLIQGTNPAAERHRSHADAARDAARSEASMAGSRHPLYARGDIQELARLRQVFGERWTRHKALVFAGGFVGLLVGVPLWLSVRHLPRPEGWDLTGLPIALIFIGAFVAHGWSIRYQLVCPSCGNDVRHMEPDPLTPDSEAQPALSLDRCPHCDLRLR
ncbi:hypothetical protein ACQKGO_01440 [Corallococcus interemptor]|uniref:hypothetical protein n=1 Tax=Corallococcus interemptor TaxID=2316720 RepID=UPI003D04A1DE